MKIKKAGALLILFVLFFAGNALAVPFAICELRNGRFVDKFQYAIDIYAVRTQEAFELGNTTLNFDFNDTALDLAVSALSGQYALFNSNNYDPMTIGPHPTVAGRLQFQITEAAGATNGDVLPDTEILLATVNFVIDDLVYQAHDAGLEAIIAESTLNIFGSTLAFLDWLGSDSNSLICLPEISGTPTTSAAVGNLYNFLPSSSDVCSAGPLAFSITGQPIWATTFDTSTGQLSGTPAFGDVGTDSNIVITVTDDDGDSASLAAFDIVVACPGPPVLSGAPTTSVVAGNTYDFLPTVTDGCGTLTFSIANAPTWASFSFNTSTGQMSGTPTLADVGTTVGIVISVEDENTDTDSLVAFDIQVTPSCTAPSISGTPDTTVVVGKLYSFTPTVSNGCAPLTFDIMGQPSWAIFDSSTGQLSGTPAFGDVGTTIGIEISVEDVNTDTDSLVAFDIQVTSSTSSGGGGGSGGGCFISTLLAH